MVVVVVVVVVGAVVPFELQATDSTPTATAAMPTVKDARLRSWAVVNDNGISLSSQSDDVTARYIPTGRQAPPNRAAGGSLRRESFDVLLGLRRCWVASCFKIHCHNSLRSYTDFTRTTTDVVLPTFAGGV